MERRSSNYISPSVLREKFKKQIFFTAKLFTQYPHIISENAR